ncbi:MAG: hypothetical protein ACE5E7_13920 [Anaerolineae bacterium]
MRRKRVLLFLGIAALLILAVAGAAVLAQTSASFNLEWHVMGNGGGASSSAGYQVNGTIG